MTSRARSSLKELGNSHVWSTSSSSSSPGGKSNRGVFGGKNSCRICSAAAWYLARRRGDKVGTSLVRFHAGSSFGKSEPGWKEMPKRSRIVFRYSVRRRRRLRQRARRSDSGVSLRNSPSIQVMRLSLSSWEGIGHLPPEGGIFPARTAL